MKSRSKGPGKAHRKGITLFQIAEMFKDEDTARNWIADLRWPHGPACPHCGTLNVQADIKHNTMTHRCRDCPTKPMFSVRTGTVMEGSKLKYRGLGGRNLPVHNEHQGYFVHEAPQGIGNQPKGRLVYASPASQGVRSRGWAVHRAGGSGRDVHRWEGAEQAFRQEATGRSGSSREESRHRHEGPENQPGVRQEYRGNGRDHDAGLCPKASRAGSRGFTRMNTPDIMAFPTTNPSSIRSSST